MADIKTHLRELSVATKIGILKDGIPIDDSDLYKSDVFYSTAQRVISNSISSAKNICSIDRYSGDYTDILSNGFRLGRYIYNNPSFIISKHDSIFWFGNDTQKDDLIDLQVGNYGFSLKEESFILENMGLYKYLNLITNSNYGRGLHVFKTFSPVEYNNWFNYTWALLLSNPNWYSDNDGRYSSKIYESGNYIILNYDNEKVSKIPKNITSIDDFNDYTSSKTREKVFSKWINEVASFDIKYLSLKRICSEKAGATICSLINKNLNPNNLTRLLQIYPKEYFYAKTNLYEMKVYKVPCLRDFYNVIKVKSVSYEVPSSQLNIITEIQNMITDKSLLLRNECRFSHGQFNGTPEAKMYYGRNEDLSSIYIPI